MIDTLTLTAEEAKKLVDAKEISGAELFAAYAAAIDERDPELHAFLTRADDPGGDGLPIAIKDVIGTKGLRTTAGSICTIRPSRASGSCSRRRSMASVHISRPCSAGCRPTANA